MTEAEQRLRTALEEIAEENGYKNPEITVKAISSEGANYTSILFLGTITSPGKDDINIFAKSANISQQIRDVMPFNPFISEKYFYSKLAKEYAEIEEKNKVEQKYRLKLPKYYGSNLTEFEETMILENMLKKGYVPFDRFKPVDKKYAFEAVKELSRFHALSMAYAVEKPDEFEKFPEECPQKQMTINFEDMLAPTIKYIVSIVSEENREKFEKFVPTMSSSQYDALTKPVRRPVITHGDFRPSNIMHKLDENGDYDIVVLDYQTLKVSCGLNDLLYFIFSGTDEAFRKEHYDDLLEFYYTQLREHLQRLNIDPDDVYSKEDFEFELKEQMLFGLMMGVFLLRIVLVAPENAPDMGSEGIDAMMNIKSSDLYVERLNGIINDYVRWGII